MLGTGAAMLGHAIWDITTTERDLTAMRGAPSFAVSVGPVPRGDAAAPGIFWAGRFGGQRVA
jgi:hypothetical protein